jgi:hypothetical protein
MSRAVRVIEGLAPGQIPYDELFAGNEPVLLRGVASGWPLVQAGRAGAEPAMKLLADHYDGRPVVAYVGEPSIRARFGYNEDVTGFNFRSERRDLREVFAAIAADFSRSEHPYYYMNSIAADETFPGLGAANALVFNHPVFTRSPLVGRIWIGTESRAAAHYDMPSNIACCVLGRRRFTLFPPSQVHNLYPGPLSPTPGGQAITMADLNYPDFNRFPRLRGALAEARVADMQPGDALYYPSMWWHEVEAFDRFNIMMNYWWVDAPAFMGDPMDVLMHALLGLRDRSPAAKQAWRELFDYYVFGDAQLPRAHLPAHIQGVLAPMDEPVARQLRGAVHRSLNR